MKTYLATLGQIKELTTISGNTADKHLLSFMGTAQDLKMKPALRQAFMDELLAQIATEVAIGAATSANPVVVTTDSPHGLSTGDSVYVQGATGMEGINGQWTVTVLSATTFELDGLDGTAFPVYDAGTATVMHMPAANVMILTMVRTAYAWWVVRDALPWIWMHITNSGLVAEGGGLGAFGKGDGGFTPGKSEMSYMQQNAQNFAEGYTNELITYLSCHSQDYPSWYSSCTNSPWPAQDGGKPRLRNNGFKKKVFGV